MKNLAIAIKNKQKLLAIVSFHAAESQAIWPKPYSPKYFNTEGVLVLFYKTLNRFFYTGNEILLNECYTHFLKLETEGWIIQGYFLKNLVFQNTVKKIEALTELWFNKYVLNLDYQWLDTHIDTLIASETELYKHYRNIQNIKSITLDSFKQQILRFPECSLKYMNDKERSNYIKFLKWKTTQTNWSYSNTVTYDRVPLLSTEINVPVIEQDLNLVIYRKCKELGIIWANKYITEPSARNFFIKANGLIS